jgi:hypothetical protein
MATATNSLNGIVTISDTLKRVDTFDKYELVVQDLVNTSRDFTGTTAQILLKQCGTTVYQNNSITLTFSTLGEVSFDLNLVPSLTETFSLNPIHGEVEYEFPFSVGGENLKKTCFILNLQVTADLIP